jgi:hypothetical protein
MDQAVTTQLGQLLLIPGYRHTARMLYVNQFKNKKQVIFRFKKPPKQVIENNLLGRMHL